MSVKSVVNEARQLTYQKNERQVDNADPRQGTGMGRVWDRHGI